MTARSFPAKLLLFGEYTVLSGSRALAVPLPIWKGSLLSGNERIDADLLPLSRHLQEKEMFDAEQRRRFADAVSGGLQFASDIPQGMGVGSSGALCAAVYAGYFRNDSGDILQARLDMAEMESYFHGTSSGMDPLVSYTNAPVLREQELYHRLPPIDWPGALHIYLIDSGIRRTTGDLVQKYLQWTSYRDFRVSCLRPLIQSVDHVISFLLEGHLPMLQEHLRLISALQFQYFHEMIPGRISTLWARHLAQGEITIKLCGAGGGGYYLAFASSDIPPGSIIQDSGLEIIPVSLSQTGDT